MSLIKIYMQGNLNSSRAQTSFIDQDQNDVVQAVKNVQKLDDKVQGMLLWSTIFSLWSYLILIFRIFKIYALFKGGNTGFLTIVMVTSYLFLGGIIFVVWQGIKYKRTVYKKISKAYIEYQVFKLNGQRKLIYTYLIAYTTLLVGSTIFFLIDRRDGTITLLWTTVPIALLAYVLGLYFLVRLGLQKRTLDDLERKISHYYMMDKVSQN